MVSATTLSFGTFNTQPSCAESLIKAGADLSLRDGVRTWAGVRRECGGIICTPSSPQPSSTSLPIGASPSSMPSSPPPPHTQTPPPQAGDTALDWAIRENHAEIVELLEIASKQVE